ncbi:MAG: imidazole glycerol phosphate synthase cyclase subunit, partial [Proteobacteria bacterium]|nr:imidazole glycerol phosphate synthase cyclase subunit [Pseudomonadota bacterium]
MKVRVIPIILLRNFGVVKTVEFSVYRPLGVATNFARVYNSRGVDELIVLDIDATQENRGPDLEYVRDISEECFMPLTVGGGIRNLADVTSLIQNGADKITINTHALEKPSLIDEIARSFGSQCVVLSIDVKKDEQGEYKVFSHGGKVPTQ